MNNGLGLLIVTDSLQEGHGLEINDNTPQDFK
jgi:hypothetical protein